VDAIIRPLLGSRNWFLYVLAMITAIAQTSRALVSRAGESLLERRPETRRLIPSDRLRPRSAPGLADDRLPIP
jgi:hypothetical protein